VQRENIKYRPTRPIPFNSNARRDERFPNSRSRTDLLSFELTRMSGEARQFRPLGRLALAFSMGVQVYRSPRAVRALGKWYSLPPKRQRNGLGFLDVVGNAIGRTGFLPEEDGQSYSGASAVSHSKKVNDLSAWMTQYFRVCLGF